MTALGSFKAAVVGGNIVKETAKNMRRISALSTREFSSPSGEIDNNVQSQYLEVLHLNYVDHAAGTYHITTIPANTVSENSLLEFEVTGSSLNNTGGNLSLLVQTFMETGGGSLVSSGNTLTVGNSTDYRAWIYTVKIQRAACGGNFVRCDEKLVVNGITTPYLYSTTVELSTNTEEEMEVWFQLGWSGATSYVNIRTIYDTWTIKKVPYIGNISQRFYSQPTGTRGYDTRINSNTATTNYGNETLLYAGETNGAVATNRTLIKITDITNLPSNIELDAAYLWMCVQANSAANARTFELYRIVRNWVLGDGSAGSGATWNTYDGTNNWGTAGCGNSTTDYDGATVLATCAFIAAESVGTMKAFAFSAAGLLELKKMADGTYNNYGFLCKAQTETNDSHIFYSADHGTTPLAPLMEILWHYV